MVLLCSQQAVCLDFSLANEGRQEVRNGKKNKKKHFFPGASRAAVQERPPQIPGTSGTSIFLEEVVCFLEINPFRQGLRILVMIQTPFAVLMVKLMRISALI